MWKPRVSEKGMMVLGKHRGAFPVNTWPGLENTQYCRSPLLLYLPPFIPRFSANGCVLWTRRLLQAPFATLHQTAEFSRRGFINLDVDMHAQRLTQWHHIPFSQKDHSGVWLNGLCKTTVVAWLQSDAAHEPVSLKEKKNTLETWCSERHELKKKQKLSSITV